MGLERVPVDGMHLFGGGCQRVAYASGFADHVVGSGLVFHPGKEPATGWKIRRFVPLYSELRCRFDGLLLTLGHYRHEVAQAHNLCARNRAAVQPDHSGRSRFLDG